LSEALSISIILPQLIGKTLVFLNGSLTIRAKDQSV
jgi:hypothetical protein